MSFFVKSLPKPLTSQENKVLFEELASGQLEAKEKIIEGNLRFVLHIAKKFQSTGVPFDDLIGIGNIGLLKAINTFDVTKGLAFATYSARCISNEILMFLRKHKKTYKDVSFEQPHIVDPDGQELTIEETLYDEEAPALDFNLIHQEELALLKEELDKLGSTDRNVIYLRFIKGLTQKETSDQLKLSQSYISRLEKKIINTMKQNIQRKERKGEKKMTQIVKANKEKAIQLLRETKLSYAEIAEQTGVPKGTVGVYASKYNYRPKEVRDQLKKDKTGRPRKAVSQTPVVALEKPVDTSVEKVTAPSTAGRITKKINISYQGEGEQVETTLVIEELEKIAALLKANEPHQKSIDFKLEITSSSI